MNALDFDCMNRAHVSEKEFMEYLSRTAERDDYTKVVNHECLIDENIKVWRNCECLMYFNSFGCCLALYNRDYNYEEVF